MIFAAITLCVASQAVFIVVSLYFVIDLVPELYDTPSYLHECNSDFFRKFNYWNSSKRSIK
jgi:hypothetical protein